VAANDSGARSSSVALSEEDAIPIGEAADRLRLSLRTLRYWEEVGLIVPSGGRRGGSRMYSDADFKRLSLVRAMKSMDLSIDELRELLAAYDDLRHGRRSADLTRLATAYVERIRARCDVLESRIIEARDAADHLEWTLGSDGG
jgi:DNA-binding transcriptional MerR regulator